MPPSLITETELPGRRITPDTLKIIAHRYCWAAKFVFGKRVLEIGCGPGLGIGYLSRFTPGIIGGDITWENLATARAYYGLERKFILMDAHKLPFKNKSFETLICVAAVIYLNVPLFLKECYRVLTPGGLLLINTPNKDIPGFLPSSMSQHYYSVREWHALLSTYRFTAEFEGAFPVFERPPAGWSKITSRGIDSIIHILKLFKIYEIAKRVLPSGIILKADISDDVPLAKDILTQPLSPEEDDQRNRIIYILARPTL